MWEIWFQLDISSSLIHSKVAEGQLPRGVKDTNLKNVFIYMHGRLIEAVWWVMQTWPAFRGVGGRVDHSFAPLTPPPPTGLILRSANCVISRARGLWSARMTRHFKTRSQTSSFITFTLSFHNREWYNLIKESTDKSYLTQKSLYLRHCTLRSNRAFFLSDILKKCS